MTIIQIGAFDHCSADWKLGWLDHHGSGGLGLRHPCRLWQQCLGSSLLANYNSSYWDWHCGLCALPLQSTSLYMRPDWKQEKKSWRVINSSCVARPWSIAPMLQQRVADWPPPFREPSSVEETLGCLACLQHHVESLNWTALTIVVVHNRPVCFEEARRMRLLKRFAHKLHVMTLTVGANDTSQCRAGHTLLSSRSQQNFVEGLLPWSGLLLVPGANYMMNSMCEVGKACHLMRWYLITSGDTLANVVHDGRFCNMTKMLRGRPNTCVDFTTRQAPFHVVQVYCGYFRFVAGWAKVPELHSSSQLHGLRELPFEHQLCMALHGRA